MISIRRNIAWTGATQGILFVLQFGVTVIVARMLRPYEMGIFAVGMAIVSLLSVLRALGLGSYIIRARTPAPPLLATVFTVNAAMALLVVLCLIGLAELGGALLNEPAVQHLLLVLTIPILLSIFEMLPSAGLERRADFRTISLINIARNVVGSGVLLFFVLTGHSYMSLAYGSIAGAATSMILYNLASRADICLRIGFDEWRDVLRYGLQMLALSGIGTVVSRTSELLLARILGLAELGLYSRASSLSSMLWESLQSVVVRVLFVDLAEQRRQDRSLRHSYIRIIRILVAGLWPALIGLALLSETVIRMLYGPNWLAAALPMSLLTISFAIYVPLLLASQIFIIAHETARQVRLEWTRSLVGLALFGAGCLVSLNWAAAAKVAENLFGMFIYRAHMERMTDTHFRDFLSIYAEGAILTLAAILPTVLLIAYLGLDATLPLPAVFCAVGFGVALWWLALRAMNHPIFQEATRLIGRVAQRPA